MVALRVDRNELLGDAWVTDGAAHKQLGSLDDAGKIVERSCADPIYILNPGMP